MGGVRSSLRKPKKSGALKEYDAMSEADNPPLRLPNRTGAPIPAPLVPMKPWKPWLSAQEFSSLSWEGTVLGLIPKDLFPSLIFYSSQKVWPTLKENYAPKNTFGFRDSEKGFYNPAGAAIHPQTGDIYVADTDNHQVQVFKPDGRFIKTFGRGVVSRPYDLVFDYSQVLICVDTGNNRIARFTPAGTVCSKSSWGSYGEHDGQFNNPRCIAIDGEGNFLVSDFGNNRVQMFSPEGIFLRKFVGSAKETIPGPLLKPAGVAVCTDGEIVIVDYGNHRLVVYSPQGEFLRSWGTQGEAEGQFSFPFGVTATTGGQLVVNDKNNHRVQIFTREGKFLSTFDHGQRERGGYGYPEMSVVFDKDNNMIIADTQNHQVIVFG